MKELLVEVIDKLFKKHITKGTVDLLEEGKWAEELWQKLLSQELEKTAWQESGGDIADLLALYERVGYYTAPIPFVEQTLANAFLEHAGVNPLQEQTTFIFDKSLVAENGVVSGTVPFVHWGRAAQYFVIVQPAKIIVASSCEKVILATNLAAEPRDTVVFCDTPVTCYPITPQQFVYCEALYSAALVALMTGALTSAVELSIQFSKERQQFGQPIHRFQLVQQHLAHLAGERAIAIAALENVMDGTKRQHFDDVLLARLRLDEAARIVTTSAHQIHAAIGVTFEHSLHHATRRLWAWRDEGQNVAEISAKLVDIFLTDEKDVWTYLTKGDV